MNLRSRLARAALLFMLTSSTQAAGPFATSADARAAAAKAEDLMRRCEYDEASAIVAAQLERATAEDRELLLLTAGMLAEHRSDLPGALRYYEEAASGDPVPAQALRMLGRARIASRQFAEGQKPLIAYVNHEIKTYQRLPSEQDLAALAVATAELGKLTEALQPLELMVERVPTHSALIVDLADKIRSDLAKGAGPDSGAYWKLAYGEPRHIGVPDTDFVARVVERIPPRYPTAARRKGQQGLVIMRLSIDETGKVTDVKTLRSEPKDVFDLEARSAVYKWRFKPWVVNCRPVPSEGIQLITFRLSD